MMVQVFGEGEKQAVRDGKVEGDEYKDGEVWADTTSLALWAMQERVDHL